MIYKNVSIKNIYYMLSYAFINLRKEEYKKLGSENFENIYDLLAEILYLGFLELLKRGVNREYIERQEDFSTIRGKIDLTETLRIKNILKRKISCIYEDFSTNAYLNQILKTTFSLLLKTNIKVDRKKNIRKILFYFKDVETLNINSINWSFRYNRNNQTYQMLIGICYLVVHGLLQKDSEGNKKLIHFSDKQMEKLYEKFILEYYKKEFKDKIDVRSSQIPWGVEEKTDNMLPNMQSDITLSYKDKILIIDAKYYEKTLQEHYDTKKLQSEHLYQIFSYVKNKEYELKSNITTVSGMLLYARTGEEVYPDGTYKICGNNIGALTLDLNQEFNEIKNQLNNIVYDANFLGVSKT